MRAKQCRRWDREAATACPGYIPQIFSPGPRKRERRGPHPSWCHAERRNGCASPASRANGRRYDASRVAPGKQKNGGPLPCSCNTTASTPARANEGLATSWFSTMASLKAAMVGAARKPGAARRRASTPISASMMASICASARESPPNAKKLSFSGGGVEIPRTRDQIRAIRCSNRSPAASGGNEFPVGRGRSSAAPAKRWDNSRRRGFPVAVTGISSTKKIRLGRLAGPSAEGQVVSDFGLNGHHPRAQDNRHGNIFPPEWDEGSQTRPPVPPPDARPPPRRFREGGSSRLRG